MPPDSPSADGPFGRDRPADPQLDDALRTVRDLGAGQFEVLGPLGRDPAGEPAFLAAELFADRLVVLKRRPAGPGGRATLDVIERLDASVPPPAGTCATCQTPFSGWDPYCPECGADLAGSAGIPGQSRAEVLAAVKASAEGFEVLGDMPRARGGANVFFAREYGSGQIVALRLEADATPGRAAGLTVAATRMIRPKLQYGTVGGEAGPSGAAPPLWTPVPSPPVRSVRGGERTPSSATTAGSGERFCPQCGESFGPEHRFCPRDGSVLRGRGGGSDLVGQVIAERYHVLSRLGEGGMGRVYLAEHVRMGRQCALKVMNPALLSDPDSVSRFNREAANASRITHPNVAAIYDFGETDELVYLAMEFVEGESLAALLEREGGLPPNRAIDIGRQVAEGLAAAHDLGIVHRDLKPDNIMVTRGRGGQDVVKVVDFGIAKATRGGRQTVTRTGYVVGTPAYMSPEQILGDPIDARSDLYSLGCILYEMVTGERAFADASGEVSIRQRLTEPPPRPRRIKHDLSGRLDALVTKSMARAPDQRYQSAIELRDALVGSATGPTPRSWRERLGWGRSTAATTEAAPLPRPRPTAAGAAPPDGLTAPVPVGWAASDQPYEATPRRPATIVHRRHQQSGSRIAGFVAAGVVAVAVVVLGGYLIATRSAEESGGVDLPAGPKPPVPPVPAGKPAVDSLPVATPPQPTGAPRSSGVALARPLPAGARLIVDGNDAALSADGVLPLPPGGHTIRVEAPGYQSATRQVQVGTTTDTIDLSLRPVPAPGPVAGGAPKPTTPKPPEPAPAKPPVTPPPASGADGALIVGGALPPGAVMTIDGTEVAQGTHRVPLAPGSHRIQVTATGYRPDSAIVEVKPGTDTEWVPSRPVALAAEQVLTVVVFTPDTTVAVGGKSQLKAGVKDETGTYLDRPLDWASGNPAVVEVDGEGHLVAVGPGRTWVRAQTANRADSITVTVTGPPVAAKPPAAGNPAAGSPAAGAGNPAAPAAPVPAAPTAGDIGTAVQACSAAFASGNERQIVETYQAKTALDVENLRKVLAVAIKDEAKFGMDVIKSGAATPTGPGVAAVPLNVQFHWRNNAGVNKKKDAAVRLELSRTAAGWRLAACRATEKVSF